jgi:pimeloyl-ACP methyl ester carboxylesterase
MAIPQHHADYLHEIADLLGISRNAVYTLTLRMGGPLLAHHANSIKESVRRACGVSTPVSTEGAHPPGEMTKTAGVAELSALVAQDAAHERRKRTRRRR